MEEHVVHVLHQLEHHQECEEHLVHVFTSSILFLVLESLLHQLERHLSVREEQLETGGEGGAHTVLVLNILLDAINDPTLRLLRRGAYQEVI